MSRANNILIPMSDEHRHAFAGCAGAVFPYACDPGLRAALARR